MAPLGEGVRRKAAEIVKLSAGMPAGDFLHALALASASIINHLWRQWQIDALESHCHEVKISAERMKQAQPSDGVMQ
jgi:hypothetical protein